jgi:demethylmenaquinone methyltransferase/2-methoxy-6-polyprenyl-1,4-benzoquinol methylase
MAILPDYSSQAADYDRTRAASPSVLAPLRRALGDAPGRRLLDVGGGTGNYALALRDEGWDPLVVDRTPAMLERAVAKGLAAVRGDALALPFGDGCFDAVMLVAVLHHTTDQAGALAEAQRVVRPRGRVAVMTWTLEDIADSWTLQYWPSSIAWMRNGHPPLADLLRWLPGATPARMTYADIVDGTMSALESYPELVLDPRWRMQTSFFRRLEQDHPDELQRGLLGLAADIAAGRAPRRRGVATVLAWAKQG